jgi:hypothetical protein
MLGSMGSQVPADYVLQFATVEGSTVETTPDTDENVGVSFNVAGIGGLDASGLGEQNDGIVYGALGIIARPLPPDDDELKAEVVCVRTADGLVPISTRDSRITMPGAAPNDGTIALVGYGGGFVSMDAVDTQDLEKGTIQVVYCPYDFDSQGLGQKAHTIILDPTPGNESVIVAHAEGMAITMFDDKLTLKSKTGVSSIVLDDQQIQMSALKITLAGGVVVGNPASAVPLLAGPASPPSSVLFLSP